MVGVRPVTQLIREKGEFMGESSLKQRQRLLKSKYDMTLEDYDRLFEAQYGCCAICGWEAHNVRLAVDHDHETGKVRALLCNACNTTVGLIDRRPGYVWLAFEYVKRFKERDKHGNP